MELTFSRGADALPLVESDGWIIEPGVEGLDTPPVALGAIEPAGVDGEYATNVRYKARTITVPLSMWANTGDEARAKTRRLASLLNPQLGPVTLTVKHPTQAAELLPADATEGRAAEWEARDVATTVTEVTTPKRSGSYALKVDPTGVFSGNGYAAAVSPTAKRVTVGAGQSYKLTAYARSDWGTRQARLVANWYASGGALIASQEVAKNVSTGFSLLSADVTPPYGAAKLGIELAGQRGAPALLYWDDIKITAQDVTREISGYLSEPFGAALQPGESTDWRRLALQIRCPDPFFLGPSELAVGQFVASTTVNNPGDALAWPTWTAILASGFPLDVVNSSITGSPVIEIADTYSSLTINTDPRALSVTSGSTPRWDAISADSTFWPLLPGNNTISGTNIGSLSYVTGTFRPRWLTAW